MQIRTKAIVLHTVKCSENTVIVHAYTEMHGRMAYVVNGAKSKRSVLRSALLQPLTLLELETDFNPKKELHRIKESRILQAFESIPFDQSKNALAVFIAELLYRSIKEPHIDQNLYAFLHNAILRLDQINSGTGNFHISFLMQYARFMGFEPHIDTYEVNSFFDLQNGIFTPQAAYEESLDLHESELFMRACTVNFSNMSKISFSKTEKQTLLSNILKYYALHLHNFSGIRSLDILYQLFR